MIFNGNTIWQPCRWYLPLQFFYRAWHGLSLRIESKIDPNIVCQTLWTSSSMVQCHPNIPGSDPLAAGDPAPRSSSPLRFMRRGLQITHKGRKWRVVGELRSLFYSGRRTKLGSRPLRISSSELATSRPCVILKIVYKKYIEDFLILCAISICHFMWTPYLKTED